MATITPSTPASSTIEPLPLPKAFSRRIVLIFLFLLSSAMYIGTAGGTALLDDADASHALVPPEMLERDDSAIMFLNGVRYLQKAPIHYWMVAATYEIFG